ncbi:MAG TPA: glucuronate isomerase, partial [Gemmatimonadales bacterium]|nr:glucuronate isomerase [Gemmatimonadales bacterium]
MVAGIRAGLGTNSLNPDRFFDPDPSVRRVARALYEETKGLPIVSPHGHVDARILAENAPFPEPAALIVQPDHYILRLLYANGVPLESLLNDEPRRVWQLFTDNYHLFSGTPTGAWLDYELDEVFGTRVYDEIVEKLQSPEFRPRALFERFNIEVLATTDAAADRLDDHR